MISIHFPTRVSGFKSVHFPHKTIGFEPQTPYSLGASLCRSSFLQSSAHVFLSASMLVQ